MTIDHDQQAVLDAALMPAQMLSTIIETYREIAAFDRLSGRIAEAEYSEGRAAALEYGGRVTLGDLP